MRILTVTTFFPSQVFPYRTVFVKHIVRAMQQFCTLDVIAPVPYAPPVPQLPRWYARSRVALKETIDGIEVLHPRYLVIPKMDWLSGFSYFLGVLSSLRRAKDERGSVFVHAHCAYPDGVGVALAARCLRLPYAITAHGSDINVYAAKFLLRPQVRWALAGANAVIAVSNDLELKIGVMIGNADVPIARIPCAGFDPSMFFPRSQNESRKALGFTEGTRIVVFVGNLVPVKGLDFLVQAWAMLMQRGTICTQDRLIIIGDGPCRSDLERRIARTGTAGTTRLTGPIPQAMVSDWIAASTLLCLPSHTEGMPNVVVEAFAMGVPVVASKVGGIPELLSEGVNGLMVEPGNAAALADALAAALQRSWDRTRICQSVAHLTWAALAARNCTFLESTLTSSFV